MGKSNHIVTVIISVVMYLLVGLGYAKAEDDPICADLSGAAFGLCTAAIAIGCDDPSTQVQGCERIAENFTRIIGGTPPWNCVLTVDPLNPWYERFEGISGVVPVSGNTSAEQTCITEADCVVSGCSGEVCAAEETISTCEYVPIPDGGCLCVSGICQWAQCSE